MCTMIDFLMFFYTHTQIMKSTSNFTIEGIFWPSTPIQGIHFGLKLRSNSKTGKISTKLAKELDRWVQTTPSMCVKNLNFTEIFFQN